MGLYLIGLGLNKNSMTKEALEALKTCDEIYLEKYTTDFPYSPKELEESYNIKITEIGREKIEDESILEKAKERNIALLVYGDVLSATTHVQLLIAAKKQKINFKIFHNSSILTAISDTGLQLYKFGKIASIPAWQKSYTPESFIDYIKQNQKIKAHTLLLVDVGLELKDVKKQIKIASKNKKLKLGKVILCSQLGTENQKIIYDSLENLPDKIKKPFCLIIPSELHFVEKEALETKLVG